MKFYLVLKSSSHQNNKYVNKIEKHIKYQENNKLKYAPKKPQQQLLKIYTLSGFMYRFLLYFCDRWVHYRFTSSKSDWNDNLWRTGIYLVKLTMVSVDIPLPSLFRRKRILFSRGRGDSHACIFNVIYYD